MNTDNSTDLFHLITTCTDEEISNYLGDVDIVRFKKDVQNLVKKSVDKEPIRQAIESLKKYL